MKKWGHARSLNPAQILTYISILYLVFPIILFGFGWLKQVYALLFFVILISSIYKTFKYEKFIQFKLTTKRIYLIYGLIILSFTWVFLSGIGGVGLQSWDFHGRNAVFHDLISHSWPVKYEYSSQPEMFELFGSGGYLIYYLCYFLPAAVFGKIFGWAGANFFLLMWSFFGTLLTAFLIFKCLKKVSIWIIVAFILFSGMDILGFSRNMNELSIVDNFLAENSLEWWAVLFQYSSFTTQLFNVFNQSIPAWMITLLIIDQKNPRNILFYYSLMIFYGPFPFIGLFPIVIYKFFEILNLNEKIKNNLDKTKLNFRIFFDELIREWVTFQNLVGGGIVLFIGFSFLFSNAWKHEYGFIWTFHTNVGSLLFIYSLFSLFEFLILGIAIFPLIEDKKKLYFVIGLLLIIPIYKYGQMNDFAMRVSIPIILLFFLIVMKSLLSEKIGKGNQFMIRRIVIILILILGSITPLQQITRSFLSLINHHSAELINDEWKSFDYGGYTDKMNTLPNYVVSDSNDLFFFEYLAK
jgi:hypothetical protein